jgi:S-adenosylmethionine decarboxylase
MNVGTEWLVDAEGCAPELLRDLNAVRNLCDEIIDSLDLRVVNEPMWHKFPEPGGVTGLYLLTESHLACHTFPESGLATFNLYCCRPRPAFAWEERLSGFLRADRVTVRTAARGAEAASSAVVIAGHRGAQTETSLEESLETLSKAAVPDSIEIKFSEPTSAREVSGL